VAQRLAAIALAVLFLALGAEAQATAVPAAPELAWSFELLDGTPRRVRAVLALQGEADGTSEFGVAPGWGGVGNVADLLHELRAEDASGRELTLERSGPTAWLVSHEPGAALALRWLLEPLSAGSGPSDGNDYRPLVTDDHFHATGDTTLVWPAWMEEGPPRDMSLTWRGFAGAGWTVASSHGLQPQLRVRRTLPDFRRAVFYAGRDLRTLVRPMGGGDLAVAIGGSQWAFRDDELLDLAARIIGEQRRFLDDPGPPLYVITLLPTPRLPSGFSLGGTGLTDSFALFVMDGIGLAPGSDERRRVARLLAHEHFHSWNGGLLKPREPEELAYWVSEGFTEFYAGRLLLAAGLITAAERVDGLNEMLAGYWASPVRNVPNERIREAFWSDADVQRLPYQRGELAALLVDDAIRRAHAGRASLDDLLRELVAEARTGETAYDTESMLARIGRWAGAETAARVRAIIVDGADAQLPPGTWAPWVEVTTRESHEYELGFDREASFAAGVVVGVREGSAAWEAGVRDGQQLRGLSLPGRDPDVPVTLTLREESGERALSWRPAGAPRPLPCLRLAQPGLF
jgi:predicted metalloprotease with PDZ domain